MLRLVGLLYVLCALKLEANIWLYPLLVVVTFSGRKHGGRCSYALVLYWIAGLLSTCSFRVFSDVCGRFGRDVSVRLKYSSVVSSGCLN